MILALAALLLLGLLLVAGLAYLDRKYPVVSIDTQDREQVGMQRYGRSR